MTRRARIDFSRRVMPWLAIACLQWCGCSGPIFRPQSPEAGLDLSSMPDARLVSEYTHPYGMNYVKVESVSLVTGLAGTGADPPPTPQRAALLDEMKRRGVENPNDVLASQNTSMVLVRAFLRPGIQEGDRFDVEVRVPSRSDTTSLRNGWLLSTRLTEMAVLGEQIRQGHLLGMAEGPVLVDPSADTKNEAAYATRGRVLGGGLALKSRPLGLVISPQHKSVRFSQDIATSVNHRFHTFVRGRKQGVATPKTDDFVDLLIHSRYKDNVGRYMQVVRNIAINESPSALQARFQILEQQLSDPLTAATAAIRLEAIGDDQAKEILQQGLVSNDPEVRFYSAEALAYLDVTEAADVLAKVARDEPAFRVNALAALSAMDDVMAYDALRTLLDARSAETRYGAFRALWAMNEHDPLVRGEKLSDQFHLHVLKVEGPPMVHLTRSFRAEIVLFGQDQRLKLPLVLDAGKNVIVNGLSGNELTITRFAPGAEPEIRRISPRVEDLIRAIVDLGGTYPDVAQALQQAKRDGALISRLEVDALPESGREYDRHAPQAKESASDVDPTLQDDDESPLDVATPAPNLFSQQR